MNTINDQNNAEYISGLLFKSRLALIDAKYHNGYCCFDIKSLELLIELKEAIESAVNEVKIAVDSAAIDDLVSKKEEDDYKAMSHE